MTKDQAGEWQVTVRLDELAAAFGVLLDAARRKWGPEVVLRDDWYWHLDADDSNDFERVPHPDVGSLADDVEEIRGMLAREHVDIWHDLDHLVGILNALVRLDLPRVNTRAGAQSPTEDSSEPWFAVRCLFRYRSLAEDGRDTYEERVTIWRAGSFEMAVERAERDARQYAEDTKSEYIGLAQAYHLAVERMIGDGDEVFSLMRDSDLTPDAYIERHFDTGDERQGDIVE